MTKREFLEGLAYELGNMDEETKNEVLADFTEHFDMGLKSGKSEEEISRILGNPKEIAADFAADFGRGVNGGSHDHAEAEEENAVEIKNAGGSDARDIIGIVFELISSEIEIRGKKTERIQIDADHKESCFKARLGRDNILYIAEHKSCSTDLDVILPQNYNGSIEVKSRNGDASVAGFKGLAELKVRLNSGDIAADDINAKRIDIKTASGDVEARNMESSGDFLASSASGEMSFSSCKSANGFNIGTGSGDIEAENCAGKMSISTGSGEISVEGHIGNVRGSTGSGDIDISTDELSGDINYTTGSGEVSVSCHKLSGSIRMSTGSGDIDFKCQKLEGNISAKTSGGDIDLHLPKDASAEFHFVRKSRTSDLYNEFEDVRRENPKYEVKCQTNSGDISVRKL